MYFAGKQIIAPSSLFQSSPVKKKNNTKTISETYWGSGIGRCLETCRDPDHLPIGGGIHHLLWDTGIAGGAEETEADLLIHPTPTTGDPVHKFDFAYDIFCIEL